MDYYIEQGVNPDAELSRLGGDLEKWYDFKKKQWFLRKKEAVEKAKTPRSTTKAYGCIKDIEPYQSPVTGEWVGSRRERRYDLQSHGCREVDPSEYKPVYRNERFMAKHGITNKEG